MLDSGVDIPYDEPVCGVEVDYGEGVTMKLGLATIGQPPRDDVVPETQALLGSKLEITAARAVDGLSRLAIDWLRPVGGDQVLTTRLLDGTDVVLAKRHILPRLRRCITRLEEGGVAVIGLLCTGVFPNLRSRKPLIRAEKLLSSLVQSSVCPGCLGVLAPVPAQIPQSQKKWHGIGVDVVPGWRRNCCRPPIGRKHARDVELFREKGR